MRWNNAIITGAGKVLTKSDLAKYPFLPEASEYIKTLDLKINEFSESTFSYILDRAENRVESTLASSNTGTPLREFNVEIPSFPIAIMLVAAINDPYLKKRYALLEAKKVSESLEEEKKETISFFDLSNYQPCSGL